MTLDQFQENLGYQFQDLALLTQALCHKSYHKEKPDQPHNEKLEFLGDAILDVILSDLLMEKFADDTEGSLSRKRASIVNEDRLCQIGQELGIPRVLFIGERESKNNLDKNPRIVASALEAIIGAVYKDQGFTTVYNWVAQVFTPLLQGAFEEHDFESDYKTRFQEWAQEERKKTPRYELMDQKGPDHARCFTVEVFVGEESWGRAEGASKKSAAQNAARAALERIEK